MAGISLWARLSTIEKNHTDDGKISGILSLSSDLWRAIGPILAWFLYVGVWPSWSIMIGWCFLLTTLIVYTFFTGKSGLPSIKDIANLPKKPHTFRHKR
jgi:hypothetical protein